MSIFQKKHIHIDKIEKVEIDSKYPHHIYEERLEQLLKKLENHVEASHDYVSNKAEKTKLVKILGLVSKVLSIASTLGIVVFLVLLFTGVRQVGNIQTGSILTIFGFTFFGGLASVGGAELFSISLNLHKAEQKIKSYESGCPFVPIIEDEVREVFGVKSATDIQNISDFCGGCPFGRGNYANSARCRIYNERDRQNHESN